MYYVWGIKLYFILDLVLGLIICVCTADLFPSQTCVKLQALGTRCSFLTSFWVRTMDVSRGRWRMHSYGIWKWWRHKYVVYLWNTLLRLALLTLTFGLKRRIIAKYSHFLPSTREKSMIFHLILHKMCQYSSSEQKICKNYLLCKRKRKGGFALAENSTTPWKISWWRPSHEPANSLCVMGSSDKE